MVETVKKYRFWIILTAVAVVVLAGLWLLQSQNSAADTQAAVNKQLATQQAERLSGNNETAILAGGCFWCVEADMEKAPGVLNVVSGYSGGETENPTYDTYADGGHREVVRVTYDAAEITYRQLLYYFIKHIDPTDGAGSFKDRGVQYSPAIYYQNQAQKETAEAVLADIESRDVFNESLEVPVLPRQEFYRAEEYHQNFAQKSPLRYEPYRFYSGRDRFYERYWGDEQDSVPDRLNTQPENTAASATSSRSTEVSANENASTSRWIEYQKPSRDLLRENLTRMQFYVTQQDGTEIPYQNELWDETRDGIYVDRLSGEPLFSSEDKYKSGTGWPSWTKPLEPENIVTKEDNLLGYTRIEVRSKYGDNHLGHVFNDGPTETPESGAEPTGLRYCLNSAALEFIPVSDLADRGYDEYLGLFESE